MIAVSRRRINSFFLLFVVVFSIWITPDLVISGLVLPNMVPLFLCLFVLVFIFKFRVSSAAIRCFLGFSICVAASLLFVPSTLGLLLERASGAVQIVLSFFVFIMAVEIYKSADKDLFFDILVKLWVILIALSALEFFGIASGFLSDIRSFIYSRSLYESTVRDIVQYGAVRPITFMREPAHLALFFSVLSVVVSLYLPRRGVYIICVSFILALLVVRSPLLVLMPLSYFSIVVIMHEGNKLKKMILLFGIVFAVVLFLSIGSYFFQDRIINIMGGGDFSAASRVVGPPLVAVDVLKDYPIFGLGPTADPLMYFYIYDVFERLGFIYQLRAFDESVIAKRVTNYFFLHFIYFGLFGGFLIVYVIWRFLRFGINKKASVSVLISFYVFGFSIGSYVTPMVWVILFLIYVGVDRHSCAIKYKEGGGIITPSYTMYCVREPNQAGY